MARHRAPGSCYRKHVPHGPTTPPHSRDLAMAIRPLQLAKLLDLQRELRMMLRNTSTYFYRRMPSRSVPCQDRGNTTYLRLRGCTLEGVSGGRDKLDVLVQYSYIASTFRDSRGFWSPYDQYSCGFLERDCLRLCGLCTGARVYAMARTTKILSPIIPPAQCTVSSMVMIREHISSLTRET